MIRSASFSVLANEFDSFLFASVGEDSHALPLSVLSVLARLDIDPWLEAAELARLPREAATLRLASSIAATAGPSAYPEHGANAARLIALLPHQANSTTTSRGTLPDLSDATKFRAGMLMYAILMVFLMTAQLIAASHVPPAPQDSSTVSPQISPPNSGK
jgi:hypothetical protein